jgi:hypothetical protein
MELREVFSTIQSEIDTQISISTTPYQAARTIAVRWEMEPWLARLLLTYITSIF